MLTQFNGVMIFIKNRRNILNYSKIRKIVKYGEPDLLKIAVFCCLTQQEYTQTQCSIDVVMKVEMACRLPL